MLYFLGCFTKVMKSEEMYSKMLAGDKLGC